MRLKSGTYLRFSIERGVEVDVNFFGPVTQAGIDTLILILQEERDCFDEPAIPVNEPERDAETPTVQ